MDSREISECLSEKCVLFSDRHVEVGNKVKTVE